MKKILITLLFLLPALASAESVEVGTVERPPFSYSNGDDVVGYSIDLVREIGSRIETDFTFREFESFSEMIDATRIGDVSLSAANISVTSEREAFLDFSQPIYESGIQILVPASEKTNSLFKIIWESGILWFVFGAFIILLFVAHLVWFFERGESAKHDYFRDDYFGGIWDAFWWAFIVATMGGFENERPEHYVGRLIAVFWVLASLFFVSALTAQITTALTVSELTTNISSIDDLRDKRVGAPVGTTMSAFLDEKNISYTSYSDFTSMLADLENGNLDAGMGGAAVSQFYVSEEGAGKVDLVDVVFKPDQLALAFPEESELYEQMNRALVRMKEDGTLEEIRIKYFGQ